MATANIQVDLDRSLLLKLNTELDQKLAEVRTRIFQIKRTNQALEKLPRAPKQIDSGTSALFAQTAILEVRKKAQEILGKLLAQKGMIPVKGDFITPQEVQEKTKGVTRAELNFLRIYCARLADKEMAKGLCAFIDKTSAIQPSGSEDVEQLRLLAEFWRLEVYNRQKVLDLPDESKAAEKEEDPIAFQLAKKLGFEFVQDETTVKQDFLGSQNQVLARRKIFQANLANPQPVPNKEGPHNQVADNPPVKSEPKSTDPLLPDQKKSDSSEAPKSDCFPCKIC